MNCFKMRSYELTVEELRVSQAEYIPGVCNIGKSEVRMRRIVGWAGLIATVCLWGLFLALKTPAVWRLILFVPALLGSIGWLQAAWRFCVAFGFQGVFNFGPDVGKSDTVEQAEYRRKDRVTAIRILSLALLIASAVSLAAFYTA